MDVIVLRSGDVDGKEVVSLAAGELLVNDVVAEEVVDSLLVVDVSRFCSEVVNLVADNDVMLETVKVEVVITPEVDFVDLWSSGIALVDVIPGVEVVD